jgi:hypothetical protein
MVQGIPVVISTNGYGLAVTEVANGLAVEEATNGYGIPVIVTAGGGLPVTFVGEDPNLLAGLSWIQGTNTTMSFPSGRVRATSTGSNARVYKTVTGLTNGATYAMTGTIWKGTAAASVRLRVSTTADLPSGDIYEFIEGGLDHTFAGQTFVMSGTTAHIGIVAVVGAGGEYSEIQVDFELVAS